MDTQYLIPITGYMMTYSTYEQFDCKVWRIRILNPSTTTRELRHKSATAGQFIAVL